MRRPSVFALATFVMLELIASGVVNLDKGSLIRSQQ